MANAKPELGLTGTRNAFGAQPHERPVPRISIDAFCEFPDTGAALQRAASDRRLAKAHTRVMTGGLHAALEAYADQPTPNLLILETRLQGQAALEEIDRLAEVCDPATKVLVVGRTNDVELYRELMRRGVSEYLVAPLNPLRVIEVVSGLYLDPESPPIGRVVSVMGCRGGVGSSTFAHNVGWCIAEILNINTAIVDLDMAFGTSGLDFNQEMGQGVADALSAPERLDDLLLDRLLVKAGQHLSLFTSPAMLEREYEFDPSTYESVLDAVRRMTPCVIVDMPHLWAPWVRQTLLSSDDIILVASPDLASLRNGKALSDMIKQNRPNDAPPRLVLNQIGQPKRPEIPAKDFGAAVGLEPTLLLPYDPALYGAAANNAQMIHQVRSAGPTQDAIRRMAELLTNRQASSDSLRATSSVLSFLTGRKKA